MIFYKQDKPSNCGQIAVASLTDSPLGKIEQAVGHSHGTRTADLRRALQAVGYDCPARRPIVKNIPPDDSFGILHIRQNGKKSGGHWVAVAEGKAWDGCCFGVEILEPIPLKKYDFLCRAAGWRITSFMSIHKMK